VHHLILSQIEADAMNFSTMVRRGIRQKLNY